MNFREDSRINKGYIGVEENKEEEEGEKIL